MTSSDIYVVVNGRVYQTEDSGSEMMSDAQFKREVLRRLDGVEGRLGKLEARVGAVESEQRVTNGQLGMLEHIIYWGFAFVTLVVAFVSWMRPRDSKPEPKPEPQSVPSRFELEGMIMDVVREMLPGLKR